MYSTTYVNVSRYTNWLIVCQLALILSVLCLMGCGYDPEEAPFADDIQPLVVAQSSLSSFSNGMYVCGDGSGGTAITAEAIAGNGNGVLAKGINEGMGVVAFSGSMGWFGVYGIAQGNGTGIGGQGAGTGAGGSFAGGPGGAGGLFRPGTESTPTSRNSAIIADGGDLAFRGASPAPATPINNRVTPSSVAKAWARVETVGRGSSSVQVQGGLNIGSVQSVQNAVEITLAAPVAQGCAAIVTPGDFSLTCQSSCTGDRVGIVCGNLNQQPFGPYNFLLDYPKTLNVVVFGVQ